MADHHQNQTVCCMCGDMGFSDKLFRCNRCRYRSQHSYCSNYYRESSSEAIEICDWCQSEGRNSRQHGNTSSSSRKSTAPATKIDVARGDSNEFKQHDHKPDDICSPSEKAVKSPGGGTPSPRTSTRRYKLLKDVMC